MTLTYMTDRGSFVVKCIRSAEEDESELRELYSQRREATLRDGNQKIGAVEKTSDGLWNWWFDARSVPRAR